MGTRGVKDTGEARRERAEYVQAFNRTMVQIWKDQVVRLGVMETGALFNSVRLTLDAHDEKILEVSLAWDFREYGLYQDRGTGRETPKGNPGDIGRAKVREKRPWMSKRFYSSFCNIRDFFIDNLGRDFCAAIPSIMGIAAP